MVMVMVDVSIISVLCVCAGNPEEGGRFSELLPGLGGVQRWLRTDDRRALARSDTR